LRLSSSLSRVFLLKYTLDCIERSDLIHHLAG
jgi:hypothetical protein